MSVVDETLAETDDCVTLGHENPPRRGLRGRSEAALGGQNRPKTAVGPSWGAKVDAGARNCASQVLPEAPRDRPGSVSGSPGAPLDNLGALEARFGIVPGPSGSFPRRSGDEIGASESMFDATSRVEACQTATSFVFR